VRERLRKGHAGLRGGGVDLLGYSLIDALVDNYFSVVERIDERLDMLEEAVFEPRQARRSLRCIMRVATRWHFAARCGHCAR
jgi:Mg2+ and Co2+ transporter CorA